jgi:hypothetical protein
LTDLNTVADAAQREAARMVTWAEVLERRRAAAAQPRSTDTPAAAAAPAAPAAPTSAGPNEADVQKMVNDAVSAAVSPLAGALEALAERLSGPETVPAVPTVHAASPEPPAALAGDQAPTTGA